MGLKEQNVLFFTRTMQLGGTENVILQLCEILQPLVNKIVVCSCGGVNIDKLNAMGIVHYNIPDIEIKSPKTLLLVTWRLKRILKNENITIIHTHHRMAAFYVSVLRLYRKSSFLNTCHNTFMDKKRLTFFSYRHAKIIACGNGVKRNLVNEFGIPEKQIDVVHNAVKPFHGDVKEDGLIHDLHARNYFIIGNIGRLSKQKGMEYYIQAIPDIMAKHSRVRFLVIGIGEDEAKLRKLAKDLKVEQYVFFMGYRPDAREIMAQLDLIVLSSLWEGLPLTPMEAFSVGRTIVATNIDGTAEIVEDGKTGLLIDAQNSGQIAEKIIWMIEHPTERCRMEQNALEQFDAKFSFKKFAERYRQSYIEVCK